VLRKGATPSHTASTRARVLRTPGPRSVVGSEDRTFAWIVSPPPVPRSEFVASVMRLSELERGSEYPAATFIGRSKIFLG
jgi:hypothetical protein